MKTYRPFLCSVLVTLGLSLTVFTSLLPSAKRTDRLIGDGEGGGLLYCLTTGAFLSKQDLICFTLREIGVVSIWFEMFSCLSQDEPLNLQNR